MFVSRFSASLFKNRCLFYFTMIQKGRRCKVYQGRSQESVSEGTKEGVLSPVGSIRGQSPGWGLGEVPRNPKNMLKIPVNVTNSVLFREKIFQRANFGGHVLSYSPLPYTTDAPWWNTFSHLCHNQMYSWCCQTLFILFGTLHCVSKNNPTLKRYSSKL